MQLTLELDADPPGEYLPPRIQLPGARLRKDNRLVWRIVRHADGGSRRSWRASTSDGLRPLCPFAINCANISVLRSKSLITIFDHRGRVDFRDATIRVVSHGVGEYPVWTRRSNVGGFENSDHDRKCRSP